MFKKLLLHRRAPFMARVVTNSIEKGEVYPLARSPHDMDKGDFEVKYLAAKINLN